MFFDFSRLLFSFLFSLLLGFGFGIIYEPIRIFHFSGFTKSSHYFVTDTLYIIFLSLVTYFYSIVMLEGKIRLFVIVGILTGWLIYQKFVAPLTKKLLNPATKFCKKILLNLLKKCNQILYNVRCRVKHLADLILKCILKLKSRANNGVKNYESRNSRNSEKARKRYKRSKTKKEKVQ